MKIHTVVILVLAILSLLPLKFKTSRDKIALDKTIKIEEEETKKTQEEVEEPQISIVYPKLEKAFYSEFIGKATSALDLNLLTQETVDKTLSNLNQKNQPSKETPVYDGIFKVKGLKFINNNPNFKGAQIELEASFDMPKNLVLLFPSDSRNLREIIATGKFFNQIDLRESSAVPVYVDEKTVAIYALRMIPDLDETFKSAEFEQEQARLSKLAKIEREKEQARQEEERQKKLAELLEKKKLAEARLAEAKKKAAEEKAQKQADYEAKKKELAEAKAKAKTSQKTASTTTNSEPKKEEEEPKKKGFFRALSDTAKALNNALD